MFALCEKWMARQDFQGSVQWIVVDDGRTPTECTMGQEYVRVERPDRPVVTRTNHTVGDNLARALPLVRAPKILIIEDDDYYGRHYIRTMSDLLDKHELVGESGSKYYRLDNSTYEHFDGPAFRSMAALARTGFSSSLIPYAASCCPGDSQVDRRIWNATHCTQKLLEPSISGLHISVKCGPGRRSHNYGRSLSSRDRSGIQLLKWTCGDHEAVAEYLRLQSRKHVVVYTAVTGRNGKPYSNIRPPAIRDVEHVCFTDIPEDIPGWKTRRDGCDCGLTPELLSRRWKCLAHEMFPEATHSIYIDASMQLLIHPLDLLSKLESRWENAEIAAVRHPYQTEDDSWTVSSELDWVVENRHAPADLIARQRGDYKEQGVLGLRVSQCGLLIRKHAPRVAEMNKLWWNQIQTYGHRRDQPSFPVAAHLASVHVNEWSHHERSAHFTKWFGHTMSRPQY